jgi:hypothetical protein
MMKIEILWYCHCMLLHAQSFKYELPIALLLFSSHGAKLHRCMLWQAVAYVGMVC